MLDRLMAFSQRQHRALCVVRVSVAEQLRDYPVVQKEFWKLRTFFLLYVLICRGRHYNAR